MSPKLINGLSCGTNTRTPSFVITHPSMLSDAGSQNRLHLPPSTNGNVMRPGN